VKTGYSRNCVNDFLNKTKRKEKKRQLIAWFFKCKKRIIQVLQLYIYITVKMKLCVGMRKKLKNRENQKKITEKIKPWKKSD
jgi:hypothetical protein